MPGSRIQKINILVLCIEEIFVPEGIFKGPDKAFDLNLQ